MINNPLLSQILPLYSSLVNVRMSTRWILLNTALRPGWIKSRCHEPSFSRQVAPPAEDGRTYKFNKYLGRFGITAFRHTPRFWGIWWAPRRSLVEWHGYGTLNGRQNRRGPPCSPRLPETVYEKQLFWQRWFIREDGLCSLFMCTTNRSFFFHLFPLKICTPKVGGLI